MWYLGYAKSGKEFEVAGAVAEIVDDVWLARILVLRRTGNRRRPDVVTEPLLPNYIFMDMTDKQFHEAQEVKHLAQTFHALTDRDVINFEAFKSKIDDDYANATPVEYEPGQQLVVKNRQFGEMLIRYRGIVERAHDMYPKIQASAEMFGREVVIELDSTQVRAK